MTSDIIIQNNFKFSDSLYSYFVLRTYPTKNGQIIVL